MSDWKCQRWYLNEHDSGLLEELLEKDLFEDFKERVYNETCLDKVFTDVLATESNVDVDEFHDSIQRALEIAEELLGR